VGAGGGSTIAECEDLTNSNRLLTAFTEESSANIEVARVKEGEDVCCGKKRLVWDRTSRLAQLTRQIAPCEVTGGKVLGDRCNSGIPSVDNVTKLSGSNFLPEIRGGEVDTDGTESRLED